MLVDLKWIPIADGGTPPAGLPCFVTARAVDRRGHDCLTVEANAFFRDDHWQGVVGLSNDDVVAWMPMDVLQPYEPMKMKEKLAKSLKKG
jgi:hypothetical protein